jgi:hypothetical protein
MRTALVLVAVALVGPAAVAQESARAVIERAVAAHGGREKLTRVRADRVRLRGVLQVGASRVPFTNEVIVQLPRHYRSVVEVHVGSRPQTVVHVLSGDEASITVDGQPQVISAAHRAQLRQTLELDSAMRLVPLLNNPDYRLTHLGTFQMQGREVVGIRVQGKGQRDLKMYFDMHNGLLVKAEHLLDGIGGKDVHQEVYYSAYREAGGYLRPGRLAAYRDGKKIMEAELIEAVPLENVSPGTFQHP